MEGGGLSDLELNAIGVLKRRAIEARILAPVLDALGREFGRDRVLAIVKDQIVRIARAQGAALAQAAGGRSLPVFAGTLERWTQDGALELEVVEQGDQA